MQHSPTNAATAAEFLGDSCFFIGGSNGEISVNIEKPGLLTCIQYLTSVVFCSKNMMENVYMSACDLENHSSLLGVMGKGLWLSPNFHGGRHIKKKKKKSA